MTQQAASTIGIDHVGLTVHDLEQSRRFFCDCLGWEVVGGNPDYPAVFVSDGHARVTLWQVEAPDAAVRFDRRRNVGLHHLALRLPDLTTLQALYERVAGWPGVTIEFSPEPLGKGPKMHCMFREPGGVRIELACLPQD